MLIARCTGESKKGREMSTRPPPGPVRLRDFVEGNQLLRIYCRREIETLALAFPSRVPPDTPVLRIAELLVCSAYRVSIPAGTPATLTSCPCSAHTSKKGSSAARAGWGSQPCCPGDGDLAGCKPGGAADGQVYWRRHPERAGAEVLQAINETWWLVTKSHPQFASIHPVSRSIASLMLSSERA